jgi:hypothetical protein
MLSMLNIRTISKARRTAERAIAEPNPSWVKDPSRKLIAAAKELEALTPAIAVSLPESEEHQETVRQPQA